MLSILTLCCSVCVVLRVMTLYMMLQLRIANCSCEGRVVSALEGGYQIGEIVLKSVNKSVS